MIPPSFELFITTFALFKAGIVPVFIDPGIGIKNLKVFSECQPTNLHRHTEGSYRPPCAGVESGKAAKNLSGKQ